MPGQSAENPIFGLGLKKSIEKSTEGPLVKELKQDAYFKITSIIRAYLASSPSDFKMVIEGNLGELSGIIPSIEDIHVQRLIEEIPSKDKELGLIANFSVDLFGERTDIPSIMIWQRLAGENEEPTEIYIELLPRNRAGSKFNDSFIGETVEHGPISMSDKGIIQVILGFGDSTRTLNEIELRELNETLDHILEELDI